MRNKKTTKFKIIMLIMALVVAVTFTGCDEENVFSFGGGEGSNLRHTTEWTISLPMEAVRTLNPMISRDEDTYIISRLIFDGLFELDRYLMPQPRLVEHFTFNEGNLTLDITLREGILWHDGEELTAEDVRFSIENYISLANNNNTLFADYVSNIRQVNVVRGETHRLTISFRNASNVGTENLIFPILPAHQFRRGADITRNIEDFIPIGTGPYRVASYDSLHRLLLEPNPYYHGDIPRNQLEFLIFPERELAMNLINVGTISVFISSEIDRDTMISNINANATNFVSNRAEFVAFNMRNGVLSDPWVRQAIAYAIDSQTILESVYLNSGILSNTLFFPFYFGNPNEEVYVFNLERSQQLLRQAGLRLDEETGYLVDRHGGEVMISILVNEDNPRRMVTAQIIQNALDNLGLQTYIIYCDWDEYVSRINARNFDIYLGGYAFNERYDLRHLLHSQNGNVVGFSNSEADRLLDRMMSGVSNEERAELFQELNAILIEELPYYTLLYKTFGAISTVSLVGEVDPFFNHFYNNSGEWFILRQIYAAVAE